MNSTTLVLMVAAGCSLLWLVVGAALAMAHGWGAVAWIGTLLLISFAGSIAGRWGAS